MELYELRSPYSCIAWWKKIGWRPCADEQHELLTDIIKQYGPFSPANKQNEFPVYLEMYMPHWQEVAIIGCDRNKSHAMLSY